MALLLLTVAGVLSLRTAGGLQLLVREIKVGDNRAGMTTDYRATLQTQSSSNIGSVRIQFCTNDPFPGTPCTPPVGFDASSASLTDESGMTGFSISPLSTANEVILTRPSAAETPTLASYQLSGVVNPTSSGSLFARIETFSSTDATGVSEDYGGLAIRMNDNPLTVSSTVPPFLLFCLGNTIQPYDCDTAAGNYIDFGVLSPSQTATGQTQLLTATNADFGFTIRVQGTTLTSGTNVIPAMAVPDVSRRGTSQFGMNLRANATPTAGSDILGPGSALPLAGYNTLDYFKFNSGDPIVSSTTSDNFRLTTVNYIVNVSAGQAPGVYVSTLTYIAVASF